MSNPAAVAAAKFPSLAFPVKKVDIPHPTLGDGEIIKGRQAIIRTDTGDVLNIVSKKYPLITHAEVFGAMDEAIDRLGLPVVKTREYSAYDGGYGKVVWTLDKSIEIPGEDIEDRLDVTITARNSYNYASQVSLELGTLRLICENGATVGHLFKKAAKRHVPSIKVEILLKEITDMLETVDGVKERMAKWVNVDYPRDRLIQWLAKRPLAKPAREEIIAYFTGQPDRTRAGGQPEYNGWEALNSITWFSTHKAHSRKAGGQVLAEERVNDLAKLFSIEELEGKAFVSRN